MSSKPRDETGGGVTLGGIVKLELGDQSRGGNATATRAASVNQALAPKPLPGRAPIAKKTTDPNVRLSVLDDVREGGTLRVV